MLPLSIILIFLNQISNVSYQTNPKMHGFDGWGPGDLAITTQNVPDNVAKRIPYTQKHAPKRWDALGSYPLEVIKGPLGSLGCP